MKDLEAAGPAHPDAILPPSGQILQVCLVVRDFEATLENLASGLGIGPFKCWKFEAPKIFDTQYQGKAAAWSMKLGGAWVGDLHFEVVAPLTGPSVYHEFIERRGPGIHHVLIKPQGMGYQAALRRLAAGGFPVVQSANVNVPLQLGPLTVPALPNWLARWLGLRFAYLDTESALGTVVELAEPPPLISFRLGNRLGKADFWVPFDPVKAALAPPEPLLPEINSLGWVVRDLDRTLIGFQRLGVGPWEVGTLDQGRDSGAWLHGQKAEFKVRLGQAHLGKLLLRVIQPLQGESLYQQYLHAHGEGIFFLGHHLSQLALQPRLDQFLSRGHQIRMAYSDSYGGRAVYLNIGDDLATSVALYTID